MLRPDVAAWYRDNTWHEVPWTASGLAALAHGSGTTAAVVLPALDEEATVGGVVTALAPLARGGPGERLVEEIVVVDSGSGDRTAEVAAAAGARVVSREDALPGVPVAPGKGEVLWRGLAATTADLVVYADADLVDVDPSLVVGLLGPLLTRPGVGLVKAFYDRPLRLERGSDGADGDGEAGEGGGAGRTGGGRVTELLARPALALLAPELSGVVQPLGGEYAGRRSVLERLPFAPGYAVEVGLLLDAVDRFGLGCLAQVDVGVRKHRHRDLLSLGETATEVLLAVLRRRAGSTGAGPEAGGRLDVPALVQFERRGGTVAAVARPIGGPDRPPLADVRAGTAGDGHPGVGPSPP